MKWDVFVSHASEDKNFVRALVQSLRGHGLQVWFDESELNIGDSLRRSIDRGLAESEYGIVVLSQSFFAKEWPQKELDGLTAREDGKQKVILPIWLGVTAEQVIKFSPLLADKLAIFSDGDVENAGNMDEVVIKIVRAILTERLKPEGWTPQSFQLLDGSEITLLPTSPGHGQAIGIGKYPITNAQYQRFVKETGYRTPTGKSFQVNRWVEGFVPWNDNSFNSPLQPVVCVSYSDAEQYCHWVSSLHRTSSNDENQQSKSIRCYVPDAAVWDFASLAFDRVRRLGFRHMWDIPKDLNVHHMATAPANVDFTGNRDNEFGVSDMFGNVWEWCSDLQRRRPGLISDTKGQLTIAGNHFHREIELRGGSFLDDLHSVQLFLPASKLAEGEETRHSDLGFRIAGEIHTAFLPAKIALQLSLQEMHVQPRVIVDK